MKGLRPGLAVFPILAGALSLSAHAADPAPGDKELMEYSLVITGGELLKGTYPDAHAPFITRTLLPLGCRCVSITTVDDEAGDMGDALRFASGKARLVIVTGGLGPTPNDITRETISEFTGIPLKEHPEVLSRMAKRFGTPAKKLRANLRRQTQVPESGGYLENGKGSAVGLIFDSGDSVVVALPGPPRELQSMVREKLVPWLADRFGVRTPGRSRTLRFVGVGQSLITQTIDDHVDLPPDLTITSLFKDSRVDFTFSLPANTPEAEKHLDHLETQLREHLGDSLYASDGSSLEEVVAEALQKKGASLVLAEIGSGGHLVAAFRATGNLSGLLAGAYVAPSEKTMARLLQIPSDQMEKIGPNNTRIIAETAAARTDSKWTIATGPVETNAHGKKHVQVVFITSGDRLQTSRIPAGNRRGEITYENLVTRILDQFWHLLK